MLTASWTSLKSHAEQHRLWTTPARFAAVHSGRGSGKTELARRRIVWYLSVKKPWPDPEYFYCMPTLGQARRIAWEKIKALVPSEWFAGQPNESRMEFKTVFGSTMRILTGEKPMRIEGLQYDGGVVDESSDQPPGMFDRSIRPALTHRKAWCWRIGVPKRFGVGAIEFREACRQYQEREREGDKQHAYFSWPSSDILDSQEIDDVRSTTEPKDYDEQYGGQWVSVAGRVYYCFDDVASIRDDHDYNRNLPIFVGSDFNVDPMAWVLFQIHGAAGSAQSVQIFDEVWKRNTNTEGTLDHLHERYGDHKKGWNFFGDASSRARKTSAAMSDYAQIRNDVRFKPSKVFYPAANPAVADRIASVNRLLRAANGTRRLFIHSRCAHLIRDLGYLSYRSGSREIEDSDPKAKHITDALGYPMHYMFPVRARLDDEDSLPEVGTRSH